MSDASTDPSIDSLKKEVLVAAIAVLVLLGAVKHIGEFVPFVGRHAFTIAAAFQLYVPIFLIGRRGIKNRAELGLSLHRWKEDLVFVLIISVITIVPFALGHHLWQTGLFGKTFVFRWPKDFWVNAANQLLLVALAEELFFRGYLQGRLEKIWPARRKLFGAPFGVAIVIAAAVFGLAHFVGEYRIDRLGPFFPALVFGLLRARTGTIVGAMGYHAFCNVLSDVLYESYKTQL